MRLKGISTLAMIAITVAVLSGCGVSKDRYNALMNEKIALEEKVSVLQRSKEALKNEYDNLLKEKMDVATKLESVTNEKGALKVEYDKILDEKVTIRANYDKLLGENKDLQDRLAKAQQSAQIPIQQPAQ